MKPSRSMLTLALTSVGAGVALPAHAALPPTPEYVPSGMEDYSPYIKAAGCDPFVKPGVQKLGDLLKASFPTTSYSTHRACGTDHMPTSEHYDSRALDWFVDEENPTQAWWAQQTINWLLAPDAQGRPAANARRLGVMYIIWDDKIWSSSSKSNVTWKEYQSCSYKQGESYDTYCHRDHIHFSLSWSGALARTSWWSGQVAGVDWGPCRPSDLNWAAPYSKYNGVKCPTYDPVLPAAGSTTNHETLVKYSGMYYQPGDNNFVVAAIQRALGQTADGSYGPVTKSAVMALQARNGLTQTGTMNHPTWRALLATSGGVITPPPPPPVEDDLSPYYGLVLQYGSTGHAVGVVQQRMGFTGADIDQIYGYKTRSAVIAWQQSKGLPVTGVIDRDDWAVLDGQEPPSETPGGPLSQWYSTLLSYGSTGEGVRVLQTELGFTGTDVDGKFGPKTQAALIAFQKAKGLTATGTTTKATWVALENSENIPAPPTSPLLPYYDTVLTRGSTGTAVRVAQTELGFTGTEVDGKFGSRTQSVLAAFERSQGLPIDGVLTRADWIALDKQATPTPPPTNPLSAYYTTVLGYGSTGNAVRMLQVELGFGASGVDGKFGPNTLSALRGFQAAKGLTVTGTTTPATWRALELSANLLYSAPASAPTQTIASATMATAFEGPTLRLGDSGPTVSTLQRALGFTGEQVDGRYGGATFAAVSAAQTEAGLQATGVTDARTWRALARVTRDDHRYDVTRFTHLRLAYGARGEGVRALQRALDMQVTGYFGEQTKATLINAQKRLGLPATGTTTADTWLALTG